MAAAVERIPLGFTVFTAVLVTGGHALSLTGRLDREGAWFWLLVTAAVAAFVVAVLWPATPPPVARRTDAIHPAILWPPAVIAVVLAAVNLVVIVSVAPHHWD